MSPGARIVWLLMGFAFAAPPAAAVPPAAPTAGPRPRHEYFVLGSVAGCNGPVPKLESVIRADLAEYDRTLRARVPRAAILASQEVQSGPQLLGLIARARAERVTVIYSGHGIVLATGGSALCVGAGPPLPVSAVIGALEAAGVSEAVIVIGACQSSRVDVRREKLRVSILSASPYDFLAGAPSAVGGSVWGQKVGELLASPELLRDCLLDDDEMVRGLRNGLAPDDLGQKVYRPRPQLRRQGRRPIPIVELQGAGCGERAPAVAPDAASPANRLWIDDAQLTASAAALGDSARLAPLRGPKSAAAALARQARGFKVFELEIRDGQWTLWRLSDHGRIGGADLARTGTLLDQVSAMLEPLDRARCDGRKVTVKFGGTAPRSGRVVLDGFAFDARRLVVADCRDEEDGQCFDVPCSCGEGLPVEAKR